MAAFSSIYVICSLYINSFFFSWGVQKITREAQPETQLHLTNDKQLLVKCSIGLVFFRFLWSRAMPVTEYFNDAVVSAPQTDASKVVFSKQLIVYCCKNKTSNLFFRGKKLRMEIIYKQEYISRINQRAYSFSLTMRFLLTLSIISRGGLVRFLLCLSIILREV